VPPHTARAPGTLDEPHAGTHRMRWLYSLHAASEFVQLGTRHEGGGRLLGAVLGCCCCLHSSSWPKAPSPLLLLGHPPPDEPSLCARPGS
jgi:hypothetical protein